MDKFRYIRYSRKSSEAKEKQALSIPDQNLECDRYAIKENLQVVKRLEESKSSYKPHIRPEFDKMLALIETGQADAILTWHPNRLCRNPEEGGKLLQLLQDGVIKEIRTAAGDTYTSESDQLILQIHFGMANQYSRDISRNVKRSLTHKAERGEFPRRAVIGFETFGNRGSKNLKPVPFESEMLKEIFEMASTGKFSLGYLVEYVQKKGLKTKNDKKISKSHIYSILTNPIYYGCFYYRGELYKGNYEPIISKTLFDKVRAALKDRSKPKIQLWDTPYNGLIKCPTCGCAITTSYKTKNYKRTGRTVTYAYLHCTHRRGGCAQPPITLEEFEKQLVEKISKINIDKEVWDLGIDLLKEKHKHETETNISRLGNFQKQYNGLQEKLNRLIDMRANEELTRDEFIGQKETLIGELAKTKSLIDDNEHASLNWLELTGNFLDTAFYARDTITNGEPEKKRKLIMDVGENLFLNDRKLEFSFKKPYDVLLMPEYRTNGLPLWDAIRTAMPRYKPETDKNLQQFQYT